MNDNQNKNDRDLLETDEDRLDLQLAQLEEGHSPEADSTIQALQAELQTMADELRQPPPANPYEDESACRRVSELVRAIGRDPGSE